MIYFKTTRRLATAQGSTLTNYEKKQLLLVSFRTMGQSNFMSKPFKQSFHITDIKHNIIGIPFVTNYTPTLNILNSKVHIEDNYTRKKNTSLIFGIDNNESTELQLNKINCELTDSKSDIENTISINMINVGNEYEPLIYE